MGWKEQRKAPPKRYGGYSDFKRREMKEGLYGAVARSGREGYEITKEDVSEFLSPDFGTVVPSDVGKKAWVRDGIIVMENESQMKKRKGG